MLEFNSQDHKYTWNGKRIPSTTQVLGGVAIRSNDDKNWNSISGSEFIRDDHAAKFGTAFHDIAELKLKGIDFSYDPVFEPWVNGLEQFLDDYSFLSPLEMEVKSDTKTTNDYKIGSAYKLIEVPLYSKFGYSGTPDFVATSYKDGSIWLIDWKTSTQYQDHWRLQTAGYENLVKENFGIKKKLRRLCVKIYEYGYRAFDHSKNWATDWNDFLSILNIYKKFSK